MDTSTVKRNNKSEERESQSLERQDRELELELELENFIYKDCSLGSVKNLTTISC